MLGSPVFELGGVATALPAACPRNQCCDQANRIGSEVTEAVGLWGGSESMRSFTWPSWSFHTVRSVRVEGRDETWLPGGYGRLGGPGNPPEKNRPGTQRRASAEPMRAWLAMPA